MGSWAGSLGSLSVIARCCHQAAWSINLTGAQSRGLQALASLLTSHPEITSSSNPCVLPPCASISSAPPCQPHAMTQLRWHTHAKRLPAKSLQARRGWVRDSEDRDRVINLLEDLEQLEALWDRWGGGQGRAPGTSSGRPCQLTHCNLASLLSRAAALAPPGVLSSQYPNQEQQSPSSSSSSSSSPQGEEEQQEEEQAWVQEDVDRLRRVVEEACGKMLRRGKMCDPRTVGVTLAALGQLGHSDDKLTAFLLEVATRRMPEAYTAQLRVIGQALQQLDYREGGAWWTATWAHVTQMLPFPAAAHVARLSAAGSALGHPAPDAVQHWLTAVRQGSLADTTAAAGTAKATVGVSA